MHWQVEPCINKAIQLLHTLRKELERHEKNGTYTESTELSSGGRVFTVMWEAKKKGKKSSERVTSSPFNDSLHVEGTLSLELVKIKKKRGQFLFICVQ